MARPLKLRGVGYDETGIFLSVDHVGLTTDPNVHIPLSRKRALDLARNLIAAALVQEDQSALTDASETDDLTAKRTAPESVTALRRGLNHHLGRGAG